MSEQNEVKPLWPIPIEVFGVTGEHESGKTTLAVTACPGPETLVYDFEKSSKPYERDLGFVRVDVPDEMQTKFGGKAKPIDVFKWWVQHVRSIPKGQYRVIVVDPASDIEQGLVDYVNANPREFGRTTAQYIKMSGLMWGDMKAYWKTILADIAARCETFFFVVHMSTVWKGDKPSKDRKAKGKATLFELASLYLKMERNKDKSVKPSAVVLKTRLSKMAVNKETGEVDIKPILPPRLPVASCHAIRQYCLNPADFDNLKPEEHIGEAVLTDDEKLMLRADIAEAERDRALAENELEDRQGKRLGGVRSTSRVVSTSRPVQDGDVSADSAQVATQDDGNDGVESEGGSEVVGGEDEAVATEEVASEEVATEEAADETPAPEWQSKPTHGEQIAAAVEDAHKSPRNNSYIDPSEPVGKGMLSALRNAVAQYLTRFPDKKDNIMKGIKKRNPKAIQDSDLTHGQAEDMQASLLRILNGPHPEREVVPATTPATQPEQPAAGKEVPKKSATKKR